MRTLGSHRNQICVKRHCGRRNDLCRIAFVHVHGVPLPVCDPRRDDRRRLVAGSDVQQRDVPLLQPQAADQPRNRMNGRHRRRGMVDGDQYTSQAYRSVGERNETARALRNEQRHFTCPPGHRLAGSSIQPSHAAGTLSYSKHYQIRRRPSEKTQTRMHRPSGSHDFAHVDAKSEDRRARASCSDQSPALERSPHCRHVAPIGCTPVLDMHHVQHRVRRERNLQCVCKRHLAAVREIGWMEDGGNLCSCHMPLPMCETGALAQEQITPGRVD